MPPPDRLLARLDAIAHAVAHQDGALAVLGLGSLGRERDRLDAYSDIDCLVVVQPGYKHTFLDNLAWLSASCPIAYGFRYSADGYKLLFADGLFCELEVLEHGELATHRFAPGRIVWAAANVDLAGARPSPRALPPPRTREWLIGEVLTNLYVGLQRYHRGEKLSAARFIEGYAIDRIIELSPLLEPEQLAHGDRFAPERRYEHRFPQTAQALPRFMQGYARTPASARAILDFLSAHFEVNPAIRKLIVELLPPLE